eukprot:Awhi_evm1s19
MNVFTSAGGSLNYIRFASANNINFMILSQARTLMTLSNFSFQGPSILYLNNSIDIKASRFHGINHSLSKRYSTPAAPINNDENDKSNDTSTPANVTHSQASGPPTEIVSPSDLCCMSGCTNCVLLDAYLDENQSNGVEPKPIDPAMKAFLELEAKLNK